MKKINYLLFTIFISIFCLISVSANIYGYIDDYNYVGEITNFNLSYERYKQTSLSDFIDVYYKDMESYFTSLLGIDSVSMISVFKYSEDNYENAGFGLTIGSTLFRDLIIDEGYDVNSVSYVFLVCKANSSLSNVKITVNSDSTVWSNTTSSKFFYLVFYDSDMNYLGYYSVAGLTYVTYAWGYQSSTYLGVSDFTPYENIFFYNGSGDIGIAGSFSDLIIQYIYDGDELDNLGNESGRNSFTNWWASLFHGDYDDGNLVYMYTSSYFSQPLVPSVSTSSYISLNSLSILFFIDMIYVSDTSSIPDDFTILDNAGQYNQGFYLIPIDGCSASDYWLYAYSNFGRGIAHEFITLNSSGVAFTNYFSFLDSNLSILISPFNINSDLTIDTIMNYYFYLHVNINIEHVSIAYNESCYTFVNGTGASSTSVTFPDGSSISLASGSSMYSSLNGYTLAPIATSSYSAYSSSGTGISYATNTSSSSSSSSSTTSLTDLLSSGLDGASSFYTAIMATMTMIGAFMTALPEGVQVALTTGLTLAILFGLIKFIAGII